MKNFSRFYPSFGLCFVLLFVTTAISRGGTIPTKIWAWGSDRYGETDVPSGLTNVQAIAAGIDFSMALQNGQVVVWGQNTYGETNVPAGLTDVISIAAGGGHCLALTSDGTVTAWGWNVDGQTNVPSGLDNVIAVAACENSSLALKSDGTLVAWGGNNQYQLDIPADLTNVTAIAGGEFTFMALRSDGTVSVWGFPPVVPSGLSNVVAIADGEIDFLALKNDGSVVIWDENGDVTNGPTGVSAIVGDYADNVFLLTNGTILVWGSDDYGITNVPTGLTNVTAIAGVCSMHVLALAPDLSFAGAPPDVNTEAAGIPNIPNGAALDAILNGGIYPESLPSAAWFEWGTTTNYGNVTPTVDVGNGNEVYISSVLSGLTPSTTYDYRIVGSNALGNSYGYNVSFTTLPLSNYVSGISLTNSAIRLWSAAVTTNATPPSVWATTNFVDWTRVGSAVQTTPGVFEFLDQSLTNAGRFYQLRWP